MEYSDIVEGIFLERPNRFVAHVEIGGQRAVAHVKNTGRCKELLVPGARIYLQRAKNPDRRTPYDLICVWKGPRLINMDSAAPNQIFAQWARESGHFGPNPQLRAEVKQGDSRFDFTLENQDGPKIFAEVKGCTLEVDGRCFFPDAPTERGLKHLNGLIACTRQGYRACAAFIIQMEGVKSFSPNNVTHPAFGQALLRCQAAGVEIIALDCQVTPTSIQAKNRVPLAL